MRITLAGVANRPRLKLDQPRASSGNRCPNGWAQPFIIENRVGAGPTTPPNLRVREQEKDWAQCQYVIWYCTRKMTPRKLLMD
jgi:hypothetical protein